MGRNMEHPSVETVHVRIEGLRFTSKRSFEEVLTGLYSGIGRPDLKELGQRLADAPDLSEFSLIISSAVRSSDLLEFLHLDLGAALTKSWPAKPVSACWPIGPGDEYPVHPSRNQGTAPSIG
jgi:hypothetical protein